MGTSLIQHMLIPVHALDIHAVYTIEKDKANIVKYKPPNLLYYPREVDFSSGVVHDRVWLHIALNVEIPLFHKVYAPIL